MKSRYEVGDLVKILDPLPSRSVVGINSSMREQAGKITTITDIVRNSSAHDGYIYRLKDTGSWNWESHMFMPASSFELNYDEDDIQDASFGAFFSAYKIS